MTEEYIDDAVETEEIEAPPEPEVAKGESVSDTVLKAWDKLKAESGEAEDAEEVSEEVEPAEATEAPVEETKEAAPKEHKPKRRVVDFEKPIEPPHIYDLKGKEEFKKWPRAAQENMKRIADQWNTHTRKQHEEIKQVREEVTRQQQQYAHLEQAMRPYAIGWAERGITETQGLLELASFNAMVERDDKSAVLALMKSRKISLEDLAAHQSGKSKGIATPQQIDYQQVYSQVKTDFARDAAAQQDQAWRAQQAQHIDSVLKQLQEESTDDGLYIHPDLHDLEFQKRLVPAMLGLHAADPNLSWEDNLRRTYRSVGGRVIPRKSTQRPNLNTTSDAARRASSSRPSSINGAMESHRARRGETYAESASKAWDLLAKQSR